MKIVSVIWKERGYMADKFWSVAEAPASDASAEARRLVKAARQSVGVFGLRVRILSHPTK